MSLQSMNSFPKHEDHQPNMLKLDHEASWQVKDNIADSAIEKDFEDLCTSLQSFLNQASVSENFMPVQTMEACRFEPGDEVGIVRKETKTQSNKAVTKIKVPEMILCFNDGECQVVKDICIDESLSPSRKSLLESSEISEKISSVLKSYVEHANDDPGGRTDNGAVPIIKDLKSSSNLEEDNIDCVSFRSSSDAREIRNIIEKKICLEELLSLPDTDSGSDDNELVKSEKVLSEEAASFCTTTWTSFACDSDSNDTVPSDNDVRMGRSSSFDARKSSQASGRDERPVSLTEEDYQNAEVAEQSNSIDENGVISKMDSEVNTESKDDEQMDKPHSSEVTESNQATDNEVNNTDSVSGSTKATIGEESQVDVDRELLIKSQNPFIAEDAVPESTAALVGSSFHKSTQEELNIPGPSCGADLSGPKVSSGHIAFSGSMSLRSDSSTTSTRSFAFPVLQSEWNYSPVKMAKADRRHLRKHRGWGVQLLCCKF